MEIRRDIRKQLMALNEALRDKSMTEQERVMASQKILLLSNKIIDNEAEVVHDDPNAIECRKAVESSPQLKMVFDAYWLCYSPYSDVDGAVTQQGYIKLHESLQHALLGDTISTIVENADLTKADYAYDCKIFGKLDQLNFSAMLYETLSTWADSTDPNYLPAFAWAVLESIADMQMQPPRIRPIREIKYISTDGTDVQMAIDFMKKKAFRSAISKEAAQFSNPKNREQMQRMTTRRLGTGISDAGLSMVETFTYRPQSFSPTTTTVTDDGSVDSSVTNVITAADSGANAAVMANDVGDVLYPEVAQVDNQADNVSVQTLTTIGTSTIDSPKSRRSHNDAELGSDPHYYTRRRGPIQNWHCLQQAEIQSFSMFNIASERDTHASRHNSGMPLNIVNVLNKKSGQLGGMQPSRRFSSFVDSGGSHNNYAPMNSNGQPIHSSGVDSVSFDQRRSNTSVYRLTSDASTSHLATTPEMLLRPSMVLKRTGQNPSMLKPELIDKGKSDDGPNQAQNMDEESGEKGFNAKSKVSRMSFNAQHSNRRSVINQGGRQIHRAVVADDPSGNGIVPAVVGRASLLAKCQGGRILNLHNDQGLVGYSEPLGPVGAAQYQADGSGLMPNILENPTEPSSVEMEGTATSPDIDVRKQSDILTSASVIAPGIFNDNVFATLPKLNPVIATKPTPLAVTFRRRSTAIRTVPELHDRKLSQVPDNEASLALQKRLLQEAMIPVVENQPRSEAQSISLRKDSVKPAATGWLEKGAIMNPFSVPKHTPGMQGSTSSVPLRFRYQGFKGGDIMTKRLLFPSSTATINLQASSLHQVPVVGQGEELSIAEGSASTLPKASMSMGSIDLSSKFQDGSADPSVYIGEESTVGSFHLREMSAGSVSPSGSVQLPEISVGSITPYQSISSGFELMEELRGVDVDDELSIDDDRSESSSTIGQERVVSRVLQSLSYEGSNISSEVVDVDNESERNNNYIRPVDSRSPDVMAENISASILEPDSKNYFLTQTSHQRGDDEYGIRMENSSQKSALYQLSDDLSEDSRRTGRESIGLDVGIDLENAMKCAEFYTFGFKTIASPEEIATLSEYDSQKKIIASLKHGPPIAVRTSDIQKKLLRTLDPLPNDETLKLQLLSANSWSMIDEYVHSQSTLLPSAISPSQSLLASTSRDLVVSSSSSLISAPWISSGALHYMGYDKTDFLLGWEEKKRTAQLVKDLRAESILVVKRQDAIRSSFESFAERLPTQSRFSRKSLRNLANNGPQLAKTLAVAGKPTSMQLRSPDKHRGINTLGLK